MLVLSYEGMKRNLPIAIERVASFLNCTPSDDIISSIVMQTTFNNLKMNPALNYHWLDKLRGADGDSDSTNNCFKFMRNKESLVIGNRISLVIR